MQWILLLVDFRGRIGRATWWITGFIWTAILTAGEMYGRSVNPPEPGRWLLVAATAIFVLSATALGIKRLHDRDKSGWRILIFFLVPGLSSAAAEAFVGPADDARFALALYAIGIAVGVWGFIELGLLPGTRGPNRYGPDPVASYD